MTEPMINVPIREALGEIKADVKALREDVHKIQLGQAASSATAVADVADDARGRAQWALWVAASSGPVSAVLTYWLTRH